MIQRIQTLYFLIVAGLLVALFFPNYAMLKVGPVPSPTGQTQEMSADGSMVRTTRVATAVEEVSFSARGIFQNEVKVVSVTYMLLLEMLALALTVAAIFLYRKRSLQIRICFALAVLLAGIQAFLVIYSYKLTGAVEMLSENYQVKYSVVDVFPLVGLFFVWFAYRGIVKDEALVRSLDRIR